MSRFSAHTCVNVFIIHHFCYVSSVRILNIVNMDIIQDRLRSHQSAGSSSTCREDFRRPIARAQWSCKTLKSPCSASVSNQIPSKNWTTTPRTVTRLDIEQFLCRSSASDASDGLNVSAKKRDHILMETTVRAPSQGHPLLAFDAIAVLQSQLHKLCRKISLALDLVHLIYTRLLVGIGGDSHVGSCLRLGLSCVDYFEN
jgi:hypothetical protein